MSGSSRSRTVKNILRTKLKKSAHVKNEELRNNLEQLKEWNTYLEKVYQKTKIDRNSKDFAMDKAIRDNERLDKELKLLKAEAQRSGKFQQMCQEKESIVKELDNCENNLKQLQRKYSEYNEQEKEAQIREKDKVKEHTENVEHLRNKKHLFENSLKESEDITYKLEQEITELNKNYVFLCEELKEKMTKTTKLIEEYESYKLEPESVIAYAKKIREKTAAYASCAKVEGKSGRFQRELSSTRISKSRLRRHYYTYYQ